MGLERLVRVLQNKQSNYDTDIFSGTIDTDCKITGKTYSGSDTEKKDIAFRVIADHIRAICFTIADGQFPSNTGAGYVIRRILRRAVRYYYSYLDQKEPLLFQLVPVIAKQFENVFPELRNNRLSWKKLSRKKKKLFCEHWIRELRFSMNILKTESHRNQNQCLQSEKRISGAFAFKLNDTYGFPIDLTSLMAREIGWTVDEKDFEIELQKQKDRSRCGRSTGYG